MIRSHRLLAALTLLAPVASAQNDTLAVQKGSTLIITGSDGVDDFELSNAIVLADGDGRLVGVHIELLPHMGTTVNGSPGIVDFDGVKKLSIDLGGGDDILNVISFFFSVFPLTLHAGDGNDTVNFLETTIGPVKLFGDDGNDVFELDFVTFGDTKIAGGAGELTVDFDLVEVLDLSVTGGAEADSLKWGGLTVEGVLKLNLLQGDDSVEMVDSSVNGKAKIALSDGANTFHATDTGWGFDVGLAGGPHADTVSFTDSSIGDNLKLRLGPGTNSLGLFSLGAAMQVGEDLLLAGGPDDDLVNIGASDMDSLAQIGARTRFKLAAGHNQCFLVGNIQFGEDVRYSGGPDVDTLDFNGNTIATDVVVALSNGTNDVGIFGTEIGEDLTIKGGSGDDTVQIDKASAIDGTQKILLGGGNNTQP